MNSKMLQLTTFVVGQNVYGVNAREVQEILHDQPITPVSLVPEYVRGLMNLRGQIITVIDMRRLFGLPPLDDETTGMNLVVQSQDESICLFVDRMATIVEVQADQLLAPSGTVQGLIARYIQNICQVQADIVMLLDLDVVLGLPEDT